MRHFLLIVVAYLFLFQLARSEGYQVNLQGQKQTGMGHTGTGLLLGPSSIHFNPGALAFLEGNFFLSGGISGVFLGKVALVTQWEIGIGKRVIESGVEAFNQ
jgi:long-chain fatty acid transport protein